MNDSHSVQDLGFGIGLRPSHLAGFLDQRRRTIDYIEITSEDFLHDEGSARYELECLAERYPIVMHGVSLSIGGTDPLDLDYLVQLRELADNIGAQWVSDHLCWTGVEGVNTHDLLPLPFTEQTLKHVVGRIHAAQDVLGRGIVLENPATYFSFSDSSMPEWEFLGRLAQEAKCQLLLDVSNVHVSASHHGFNAFTYINALAPGSVRQIHLGGYQEVGNFLLDTHNARVSDAVWELYAHACRRLGPISTLIEWDADIPELSVLESELDTAVAVRRKACCSLAPILKRGFCPVNVSEPQTRRSSESAPARYPLSLVQHAIQAEIVRRTPAFRAGPESNDQVRDFAILGSLTSEGGLEIYARNYWVRQLESLRLSYPILGEILGSSFDALAQGYIQQLISCKTDIHTFCDGFQEYLAGLGPCKAHWGDLIAEVATFELAVKEARTSAGVERRQSVHANDISDVPLAQISDLRFGANPSLRLLALDHAPFLKTFCQQAGVQLIWSGHSSKYLAICRKDYTLRVVYLEHLQYGVLRDLVDGCSLGHAVKQFSELWNDSVSQCLTIAREWCCTWAESKFFSSLLRAATLSAAREG
jgi:uncharacterized protein (UPF0276 family)